MTKLDKGYLLHSEQWLPRDRNEIFAYFQDAGNLEELTPDTLRFEVLTPQPIEMRKGATIDYRLKIRGLPIRWQSEITTWQPPQRFIDEQIRGPYRWWKHEHTFQEQNGGTLVVDHVRYGVPGGGLIHWLMVKRDVKKIFEYRRKKLQDLFPDG